MSRPLAPVDEPDNDCAALFDRAYRATALSMLFGYPEPGHLATARARLALLATPDSEAAPGAEDAAIATVVHALDATDDTKLAAEYARLFMGRTHCSLYSASHGLGRSLAGPAPDIADVNGFYLAFGMTLPQTGGERPDHLPVQLEFYAALLLKEAYAAINDWAEPRAITAEAACGFLEDHLGRWQGRLSAPLAEADAAGVFCGAAAWLDAWLAVECGQRGVRPQPFGPPTGLTPEAEEAIICPHGDTAHRPLRWVSPDPRT